MSNVVSAADSRKRTTVSRTCWARWPEAIGSSSTHRRPSTPTGEPLQAFTAIGQVVDDEPYQVEMTDDFHPWRRNVDFLSCTETPIRPLIDRLDFIEDKRRWGYKFRFGVFRIDDHDLDVIRSAMTG